MALYRCNKTVSAPLAILAVASLAAGCAGGPPAPESAQEQASPAAALQSTRTQSPLSLEQKVAYDRGVAALQDGNGLIAVEVFLGLSQQMPDKAALHANLGSAYMLQGNAKAAITAYQRAVELRPNLATAHVRLGVLFRRADRLQEAEAAYRAAINANPKNRLAHLNLGILYDLYLRQPALALQQYERFQALSQQPDEEVALWIADLKRRL